MIHARNKRYKGDVQVRIVEYLRDRGCADCGERDPIVLEFDHLSGKKRNVSELIAQSYSWNSIMREVANCEVVCANCHRRRTFLRSGAFKWRLAQLEV
jgi:5-methylcytosine-specific restriction endonuclease McrA